MSSWKETIVEALTELGGLSHYSDLYKNIKEKKKDLPKSWQAIIRRTIENHSSDSEAYSGKENIFYSVDGIGSGVWGLRNFVPDSTNISFPEGKLVLKNHILRERNPKVIIAAKKAFKDKYGKLFCEVCGFDFKEKYGELGADFIEGHHTKPVSELEEGEHTKIEDITMVCSNCHKMLHRKRPWLNKYTLQNLLKIQ